MLHIPGAGHLSHAYSLAMVDNTAAIIGCLLKELSRGHVELINLINVAC